MLCLIVSFGLVVLQRPSDLASFAHFAAVIATECFDCRSLIPVTAASSTLTKF